MSLSIPACPGAKFVADDRVWFIPKGFQSKDATICQECKTKHSLLFGHLKFDVWDRPSDDTKCNCDFGNQLWRGGFSVAIQHATKEDKFRIAPVTTDTDLRNGLAKIAVPTQTPYVILIKDWHEKPKSHYMPPLHFTIEKCEVGNDKVTINDGEPIYFSDQYAIEGKSTGAKGGFKFVSLSDGERAEGKSLPGYNVSNIIKLKIKVWKRIPKQAIFRGLGEDSMYRSFGYEGALGMDDSTTTRGHATSFSFGGTASTPTTFSFGAPTAALSSYRGGATVDDRRDIKRVNTTTTDDTFKELDTIDFTIQLVCDESEADKRKKNIKGEREEIQAKLEAAKRECMQKGYEITQLRAQLIDKQKQLAIAQAEVVKFGRELTSHDTDGLMQFDD